MITIGAAARIAVFLFGVAWFAEAAGEAFLADESIFTIDVSALAVVLRELLLGAFLGFILLRLGHCRVVISGSGSEDSHAKPYNALLPSLGLSCRRHSRRGPPLLIEH